MQVDVLSKGDIWQYVPGKTETTYSANNIFVTLAGTPAISTDMLVLNASEVESLDYFKGGALEMVVNVPAIPTTGDVRAWGYKTDNMGNVGRMEFDITDDVFSAQVYDKEGTLVDSKPIVWDAAWTATDTTFKISYGANFVLFEINGVAVARLLNAYDFALFDLTHRPISIHLQNSNSDEMKFALISQF